MHCRTHRHPERKTEAEARQKDWASLSPKEQIEALDTRLGKGVGATKQRLRLSTPVRMPEPAAQPRHAVLQVAQPEETAAPKKLKAKERRAKAAATEPS